MSASGRPETERGEVAIVGGGGHALVVASTAVSLGFGVAGYYDDDPGAVLGERLGLRRLGDIRDAVGTRGNPARLIVAIGDLARRRALIDELGAGGFVSICAAGTCATEAKIGQGVFVAAGACVQAFAEVRDHAIVNTGAIVEHECRVGENAHVAPGAVLGGRVTVGRDTLVGLGARVLPGVHIGALCVIGAGSVVLRDLPAGSKVAGSPARPI